MAICLNSTYKLGLATLPAKSQRFEIEQGEGSSSTAHWFRFILGEPKT